MLICEACSACASAFVADTVNVIVRMASARSVLFSPTVLQICEFLIITVSPLILSPDFCTQYAATKRRTHHGIGLFLDTPAGAFADTTFVVRQTTIRRVALVLRLAR